MTNNGESTRIYDYCKENYAIIIVIVMMVLFLAGALYLNGNLVFSPHDNLDATIPFFSALKNSGTFFSFDGKVGLLGGISRMLLHTDLSIENLIYYFLDTLSAYIVVWFLKVIIGITSFTLLFRELIGKDRYAIYRNIIILIGFAYGLLWGFPVNYFSAVSVPLIVYLLIKVRRSTGREKYLYYLLVFLYPILSRLFLYGIFICGFILVYILYDLIRNKSLRLVPALLLLALGYCAVEYRYFYYIFVEHAATIKSSTVIHNSPIKNILAVFLRSKYHSESVHLYLILPLSILYFLVNNIKRIMKKQSVLTFTNLIVLLILLNTVICGIYRTNLRESIYRLIPVIKGLNFERTFFFNPLLWYILFFYCIKWIYDRSRLLAVGLVLAQVCIIIIYPCQYNDIRNTYDKYYSNNSGYESYSFSEFYSPDLFDEVKETIHYHGEYSIAFRFHPGVLTYNGINTLDGYHSSYPQSYKEEFREMALPQLEQNKANLEYFDNWGGRAYVSSNEVSIGDFNRYNKDDLVGNGSENIYINTDKFKEMNGVYIFSNGKIANAQIQGFEFITSRKKEESPYIIYVYRINDGL